MATKNWKPAAASPLTTVEFTKRKEVLANSLNIEAEVLEVHWQSGIDTARNKNKITAPHWKLGELADEEDDADKMHFKTGSQKPGVYLISGKGSHELKVKIKVVKSGLMGEATLRGTLGTLTLSGAFTASAGEHLVTLKIEKPPKECQHFEGDATWLLDAGSAGSKQLKDKTRLEVFFVLDTPPNFYIQGVWVEALRLLFKNAGVTGLADSNKIAGAVATYCHTKHGMRYDTFEGASKFGATGSGASAFNLMKYIRKKGKNLNVVNCYDQAAAVQSLVGAIGIRSDWIFLNPYGFILKTNLVGVGQCNNPFFSGNDTKPVITDSDPKRTAFGNHAIVALSRKILDACAGPHSGSENLQQYMKAAIDAKTTVPLVAPGFTPERYFSAPRRTTKSATRADGSGVMKRRHSIFILGAIMSSTTFATGEANDPLRSPRLLKFRQVIGFDAALAEERKDEFVDLDWLQLPTPPGLQGWKEITHELNPPRENGSRGFSWQFEKGQELLSIAVDIYSTNKNDSSKQFLLHADSSTMMDLPWVRGPVNLGTVAAMSKLKPPSTVFWFYRNVFAEVSPSSNASVSALEISSWVQSQMEVNTKRVAK